MNFLRRSIFGASTGSATEDTKYRTLSLSKCAVCLFFLFSLFSFLFSCNEPPAPGPETWQEATPLKDIYQNDFLMGNIIRNTGDFSNADRSGILKRHYNVVTAENHMKPDQILPGSKPASDNWCNLTTADTIVNTAIDAGLKVHGHTLIWHSQSRDWLAAGGEEYMNKFITEVMTHYKGKVISWDVVNEAFRDGLTKQNTTDGKWKDYLRGAAAGSSAPWYASMGADYIEKAFRFAREADPDAILYYNDYNMNLTNLGASNESYKGRAVYYMVKEINEKYKAEGNERNLIDGIGMQSHHHLNTDPATVKASIELFASLGVEISITELDIQAAGGDWGPWGDGNAQKQAALYASLFRIFTDNAQYISRVTFWGLDDGTSWRGGMGQVNAYPTLLTKDFELKPAFYAVHDPDNY